MTPYHTTLDMEICMATGDSKITGVSYKYKRQTDNKRYLTSGISSRVAGTGICGGGA